MLRFYRELHVEACGFFCAALGCETVVYEYFEGLKSIYCRAIARACVGIVYGDV